MREVPQQKLELQLLYFSRCIHACMHACMQIFSKVFYDTSHMWYITLEKELELYLLWFWLDAMEYKRSYTTTSIWIQQFQGKFQLDFCKHLQFHGKISNRTLRIYFHPVCCLYSITKTSSIYLRPKKKATTNHSLLTTTILQLEQQAKDYIQDYSHSVQQYRRWHALLPTHPKKADSV